MYIFFRYLGTGSTFKSLAEYFLRGNRTVGMVIAETTEAIWKCLQPFYMPTPNCNMWRNISQRFQQLWSFPHCLGAIDGKHVRIKKFNNAGSRNINYKGYHSVQLLACSDADGCFITVDVGDLGRNSDAGVFATSSLGRWLDRDGLDIPIPEPLPLDENNETADVPYFFCGDEAFPLKLYLMRPYPRATLNDERRIFNYRLSLARKTVECSFGMLTAKFRVFHTPICCSEETVTSIIKSACVLHNFIRRNEGVPYSTRHESINTVLNASHGNVGQNHLKLKSAKSVREYLTKYFVMPGVAIPSQWVHR